jgi:hypothetical protein
MQLNKNVGVFTTYGFIVLPPITWRPRKPTFSRPSTPSRRPRCTIHGRTCNGPQSFTPLNINELFMGIILCLGSLYVVEKREFYA